MSNPLKYAVHAYSWTSQWSNDCLRLVQHVKDLGLDLIEIPLMDIDLVDPAAIKAELEKVGLGVCTSTALSASVDITSDDADVRRAGLAYLKECVRKTAAMGADCFSGVIYSAISRKLDGRPEAKHWKYAAENLKEAARLAGDLGLKVGIEPVNRYETFLINTAEQALELRQRIDEPNVYVHLDAYHMNIEETGFYEPTKLAAHCLCHYHLSESHRGVPGEGLVDWEGIYRALAESNYRGIVGLESFVEPSESMRGATCIWRDLAPSSDVLISQGLKFLKRLEEKYYSV
ncbi:MAG: sugar phosphate isomerase/epimerase family protein [Planctomycetota bacterium]|nr:sugar phosphate isomerase/epimerase family protein [Planctomycetota bacterium]